MQHEVDMDYDLENSPLHLKTDSLVVVGSDEEVYVSFNTAGGEQAGGVRLYFTSPPRYALVWCHRYTSLFPTALPSETDKIWTITLSRAAVIRVTIQCNDKEVLDVVLSGTTCDDTYWNNYWSKEVKKIRFTSSDTASDYYRPGK